MSTLIRVTKWSVLLQKVKRCPSNGQRAIARFAPHGVFVMGMPGNIADRAWSLTSTGVIVFMAVGPRRPEGGTNRVASREPRPGEDMSRVRRPCLVMTPADVDRTRCIYGLGKGPFVRGIRVIPKWGKRNGVGESPYAARGVESIGGCQASVKSARSRPDFAHELTVGALASRGSGAARDVAVGS